ncbi:MAG: hypothetical protein ACM31I_01075 [Deltaproteobacteria bacterium]
MIRFLSSTKLAVALCLVLAAEGVAGSLLYKGNTAFDGQGPFNLFRSPLFLAPAGLLVVNIIVCAGRRLAGRTLGAGRAWTFAGIHLGLVLLAVGMIVDGVLGFVGTRNYHPGVPSSEYFDWRTFRQENFPFTVEVKDLAVRYHPLYLQVGVRDAAGKKLGLYAVREGCSFRVKGIGVVVTPRRFDPLQKTLLYDVEAGGRSSSGLVAGTQGAPPVAGVSVVPVSWHDPEPSEVAARVVFSVPGRPPVEKVVRVNDPATFGGISFCLVGESEDAYRNVIVGLQMTREPGAPLFWTGSVLFGLSLVLHLLIPRATRAAGADAAAVAAEAGESAVSRTPAGIATLTLLAAAGAVLAAGPSRAASGTVIANDAMWEGDVTVTSPVTVEKGATLRIRPGTLVRLSGEDRDGDGCRDGYIQVFGRLIVEGEKGRPVRFAALSDGIPWQEIFLKDAEGVIRHAEFSGALWGLHVHDGDVRVEHAVFRRNGGGARLRGTGAAFTRCTFRDNGVALRFWDGGPAVADSIIEGNGVGLFYREGKGGGRFRGNRIGNREWNLKVGDWAVGDLDASGNYWSTGGGGGEIRLVKDYRENREPGRIRLAPALTEPPAACGADEGGEEQR